MGIVPARSPTGDHRRNEPFRLPPCNRSCGQADSADLGGLRRTDAPHLAGAGRYRDFGQPCAFEPNGAAQESNLPTHGLHAPAGFEDEAGLAQQRRSDGVCAPERALPAVLTPSAIGSVVGQAAVICRPRCSDEWKHGAGAPILISTPLHDVLQVRVSVHLHLPDHNVRRHVIDVLKLEHDLHDHHHNHGDHEQGHESEARP